MDEWMSGLMDMQALQMRQRGEPALPPLPMPTPGPRDVLIRTLAATICTSDLHDLARNPFGIDLPRVLGHEAAASLSGAEQKCANSLWEDELPFILWCRAVSAR